MPSLGVALSILHRIILQAQRAIGLTFRHLGRVGRTPLLCPSPHVQRAPITIVS